MLALRECLHMCVYSACVYVHEYLQMANIHTCGTLCNSKEEGQKSCEVLWLWMSLS